MSASISSPRIRPTFPTRVAGQLGNRIQHALRAYTPRDQRAIRAAAETFRINPKLDVAQAITELKVGEALVSTLQDDGSPSVVQRTLIAPPRSRIGPVSTGGRAIVVGASPFTGKYDHAVNRESAEEVLAQKSADAAATAQEVEVQGRDEVGKRERKSTSMWSRAITRAVGAAAGSGAAIAAGAITGRRSRANPMKTAASSAAGSIATELGGPLVGRFVRNIIGGLMR